MRILSDSSPLITLSKIGRLDILPQLYGTVTITPEGYAESSSTEHGSAGSSQVSAANWIEIKPVQRPGDLPASQERLGLGIGEVSIVTLGLEVKADILLMDDRKARRLAQQEGLAVLGCVGVLQDAFGLKLLADLTQAYRQLLVSGAYVDRMVLEKILEILDLPPI